MHWNFKFKKKWLITSLLALTIVPTALVIVSCSSSTTNGNPPKPVPPPNPNWDYSKVTNEQYISEREMSIKLDATEPGKPTGEAGTGWIMDRDMDDLYGLTYYVATNIHVIDKLSECDPSKPVSISVASTLTDADTDKKLQETDYISLYDGIPNNDQNYLASIKDKSQDISFGNDITIVPLGVYDMLLTGFLDFGIMKIHFPLHGKPNELSHKIIDGYNQRPTRFAAGPNKAGAITSLGGYPVSTDKKYTQWKYYNDKKVTTVYPTSHNQKWSGVDYGRGKANDALIDKADLGEGASGSMVTNDNKEVVAIYWGAQSATGGNSGYITELISSKQSSCNIIDLWGAYCKANKINSFLMNNRTKLVK